MKDRYGLVAEDDVLISKICDKSKRIVFCAVWIAGECTFIYIKSHTCPQVEPIYFIDLGLYI